MCYKFLLLISFLFFGLSNYSQECITITQQPENQLLLDDDDITILVEATSNENLTYQWQIFDEITNSWINVQDISDEFIYNGFNTPSLLISNISSLINNTQIRVIITGQSIDCNITSEVIAIRYTVISVNNIFTPNNDGFNDFFVIDGIINSQFSNSKLKVYNRWGNLVYEKTGYQNDWAGIATTGIIVNQSKKLPAGTYFYTLNLNYDDKKFSGWIYIVR